MNLISLLLEKNLDLLNFKMEPDKIWRKMQLTDINSIVQCEGKRTCSVSLCSGVQDYCLYFTQQSLISYLDIFSET